MTAAESDAARPVDYTEKGSIAVILGGITRHIEEAYRWVESFETKGFRQVIAERDAPFGDYGATLAGD